MASQSASHAAVRYVSALTGMRALAALLVLLLHTNHFIPANMADALPFLLRGYLGVDFFFILSGFIITHVYLASLAHPTWSATKVFLWHRLVRLYPVHATVLGSMLAMTSLAAIMGIQVNNPEMLRMGDLYAHLLLIHAWGVISSASWNAPAWSISAEWFVYLLFPALAPMLMRLSRPWSALALAAVSLGVMVAVLAAVGLTLEYSWLGPPALVRVTGEFICGAALCRALMLSPGGTRGIGRLLPR